MYQYTKSIGFRITADDNLDALAPKSSNKEQKEVFEELNNNLKALIKCYKGALFYTDPKGNQLVKPWVHIKYTWLREFTKQEYYQNKLNEKHIKVFNLKSAPFLDHTFTNWLHGIQLLQSEIESLISKPLDNKTKNVVIWLFL